jgi:hypothetical protein
MRRPLAPLAILFAAFLMHWTACGGGDKGVPGSGGTTAGTTTTASGTGGHGTGAATTSTTGAGGQGGAPCADVGACAPGTWVDVTPAGVDLVDGGCGNYGTQTVVVDPARPSDLYAQFNCQGVWKSTDYGATWSGPVNTGTSGAAAGNCAGGIAVAPGGAGGPPTLYEACIRGSVGFWASTNGGVDWTSYPVAPLPSNRQDVYPPSVDPYDPQHLLMTGHEQDAIVESHDGGQTWTNVPLDPGMNENGGTGFAFFIDTGVAATTAQTWLWLAQQSGGTYGTWRTSSAGGAWTQVDTNEHPHGCSQIYQPDPSGVVYMAGAYSAEGWGVLRSGDFGQTWAHAGGTGNESVVFGTPANVYAMYGWAIGAGQMVAPSLEIAAQPGTGTWTATPTPAAMTQGPAQVAVTSAGTQRVLVAACWNVGLYRYVEP